MKVLVTGNMGYVGTVLVDYLKSRYTNISIDGFDYGYFANCNTSAAPPERRLNKQIYGDIREINEQTVVGYDAVIHLAAISNDPMGKEFEKLTADVNYSSSINLAKIAKKVGVGKFIFASSCSVYGFSDGVAVNELSKLDPLTEYARSKVSTELGLNSISSADFKVINLRFATACGASPRTRLDLVFNDFVASAISIAKIEILSNGEPWRPLIHVKDMARAIDWAINSDLEENSVSLNVGSDPWTFQIKTLSTEISKVIKGTSVFINKNANSDARSYRVSFDKFKKYAPNHQPIVNFTEAVNELAEELINNNINLVDFRNSELIRLYMLNKLKSNKILDSSLRWF